MPVSVLSLTILVVAFSLFQSVRAQNLAAEAPEPTLIRVGFPNDQEGEYPLTLGSVGDMDGDGVADLVVGFRGAGYPMLALIEGRNGRTIRTAPWPVEGDSVTASEVMAVEGIADVDGDGVPDLAVGAWSRHYGRVDGARVYVVSGRTGALLRRLTAPQPAAYDYFGSALALLDDITGDGVQEVGIGSMNGGAGGRAYVYDGRTWEVVYTWDAPATVPGPGLGGRFGEAVSAIGDVDADGVGDVGVGASYDRDGRGTVSVYSGKTGGLIYRVESPAADQWGGFGQEVSGVGDLDGDGVPDFAVGAPYFGDRDTGRAYIFSGRSGAPVLTIPPPGYRQNGWFGMGVVPVSPLVGDGGPALLISAPGGEGLWYVVDAKTGEVLVRQGSPTRWHGGQFGSSVSAEGWIAVLALDPPVLYLYKYGDDPQAPFRLDAIYPNPTLGAVTVRASLPQDGPYQLAVIDMLGRPVYRARGVGVAGTNELSLSLDGLPPAVYVVVVEVGETRIVEKVAVIR